MKAGWERKAFKNVLEIRNGKNQREVEASSGQYPIMGSAGKPMGFATDYICEAGTTIIGRKGTINTPIYVQTRFWNVDTAFGLSPNSCLDSKFLHYFCLSYDFAALNRGTTIPSLVKTDLLCIEIPLPPLDEQRRIVAVLDKAFAGIATATANAQKNLTNARALFETSIQVAFAKSAERIEWTEHTVETVAANHRGAIRTGPFGSQLLHSEFVDEGIAVLGIDNAVTNDFRWDKLRFISPEKYEALSRYRVYPGDVIITIMGTCGRCAVIPDDIPIAINTKHLCCITIDTKKCLPQFLHSYFLYHPVAQEYLGRTAKGSIMAGLNMGLIKEMPLKLPPIAEQERLISLVADLKRTTGTLADFLEYKLDALSELKQSLLQKAFVGELTSTIPELISV